MLPLLVEKVSSSMKNSINMKRFYEKAGNGRASFEKLADIPPLPVIMFKQFDLRTCDERSVVRVLNSSATTTGIPSRIFLDKATAFRQTKGLISILIDFIGKERKPLLVVDSLDVNDPRAHTITARGAAIRGISAFAKKSVYVMDGRHDLSINEERLNDFFVRYRDADILVYGFTYILWSEFVEKMEEAGKRFSFKNVKILHSGGWKKLREKRVEKKEFNRRVAGIFGTKPENVIDFYGLVEQVGVVFPDCEEGWKHVPDFAEVIIRDPLTMEEDRKGGPGLIEIMSILPSSYPGEAVLTEDRGRIVGIDDCPCGRKGKYFEYLSRVEKAEVRGCGDTFAERSAGK